MNRLQFYTLTAAGLKDLVVDPSGVAESSSSRSLPSVAGCGTRVVRGGPGPTGFVHGLSKTSLLGRSASPADGPRELEDWPENSTDQRGSAVCPVVARSLDWSGWRTGRAREEADESLRRTGQGTGASYWSGRQTGLHVTTRRWPRRTAAA